MEDKETGRLEAFSDGVFAVAITLLVLNIKIPGVDVPASQLPNDKFVDYLAQRVADACCLYNVLCNNRRYVDKPSSALHAH